MPTDMGNIGVWFIVGGSSLETIIKERKGDRFMEIWQMFVITEINMFDCFSRYIKLPIYISWKMKQYEERNQSMATESKTATVHNT